jgi:hypothetical protein
MRNNVKVTSILLSFVLTFLLFASPQPIFAEAGLSEAGRTEYYKINEKYAFSILPGGDGGKGKDIITLLAYKENPNRNFFSQLCSSQYTFDRSADLPQLSSSDSYIQGDFIFDEYIIFNWKTGELINTVSLPKDYTSSDSLLNNVQITIDQETGRPTLNSSHDQWKKQQEDRYNETIFKHNLRKESATLLTQDYIKNNFNTLDIENLDGFGCFIIGFVLIQVIVLAAIIVAVAIGLSKLSKRAYSRKHTKS